MADASNITVSVERAIHDGLRKFAQHIYDEHRVKIREVQIEWLDTGSLAEPNFTVAEVNVHSTTKEHKA